jgi:hypothetical protein
MNTLIRSLIVMTCVAAGTSFAQQGGGMGQGRGGGMGGERGMGGMGRGAMITQGTDGRLSPHETVGVNLGGRVITITYGRPFSRAPRGGDMRTIWGSLVPWGEAWRLGADEATLIVTPAPLVFGSTTIPAGAYTLYMMPQETGTSELVFSRNIGKWGIPVDTTSDVARVPLTKSTLSPANDQLKLTFTEAGGTVTLNIQWEATQYSASFTLGM